MKRQQQNPIKKWQEKGEEKALKYVYFFGNGKAEGRADMKHLLGGKGANLAK